MQWLVHFWYFLNRHPRTKVPAGAIGAVWLAIDVLVVVQFWCTQTMTRAPAGVLVHAACQNDLLTPPVRFWVQFLVHSE